VQAQLPGFDAVGQVNLQRPDGASPAHAGADADGGRMSLGLSATEPASMKKVFSHSLGRPSFSMGRWYSTLPTAM
jgi:hypothetical protein